ncbi:MAG: hypothetical protein MUF51_07630, partial [Vicinamibacteria bacterium]|nr:hypothetical protein [Vicinamibacteria bacterium]
MLAVMRLLRSEKAGLLVLALLPLLAYAPALTSGHLLGPGDGATLHLPLRAAVWDAYRHGEMPFWNGGIFSGTPLLASYRPGALYPPMLLLAWLPPFWAFQVLVVASLQGAALLAYFYARRVGARAVGAYLSALSFSLGPYLVGHLEDTATIIAAPLLPLLLFNLEGVITHNSTARRAALALSVALLILAGSPEAAGAGLIFFLGRMAILAFSRQGHPDWRSVTGPFLLGCALAAPQL